MVKHSNYWFETSPTRSDSGVGFVKNVDTLIIGGGISGMSLLFQLIRSGLTNTYLLEENVVGYRASGRASGQLMVRGAKCFSEFAESHGEDFAKEYLQFSVTNAKKFTRILQNTRFDADLISSGGLRLALTKDELDLLKREYEFVKDSMPAVIMDELEVKSILPSKGFLGGLYLPLEATVNPYKIIDGVRSLVETVGNRIISNSCVDSVSENEDGSLAVSIRNKGIVKAQKVVYCTNAYTSNLLPEVLNCFTPFRGQMFATDILPDQVLKAFPEMSLSCNYGSEYMRLHGNRLLLGGKRHDVRGKQEGTLHDGEISKAVFDKQKDFLKDIFPYINVKITHAWSGIMCSTTDELPLLGALPNRTGQYIMAGFNGYGFSHSFISSLIMRDVLTKGTSTLPCASLFDPARLLK